MRGVEATMLREYPKKLERFLFLASLQEPERGTGDAESAEKKNKKQTNKKVSEK